MSTPQPTCRIIPCLDLADGRVVKGVNFVDLNDAGDPIEVAARYADAGADEIVLLNITGDSQNNAVIHRILAQLSHQTDVPIIVGGRSEEHTSELQSRGHLVCRLLLEKKKNK